MKMATAPYLDRCPPQANDPIARSGVDIDVLARLCARTATAETVHALAETQPDWDALLELAADHSITPLACKRLLELCGDALPAELRAECRRQLENSARRNMLFSAELLRILRALEQAGVRAVPFKGPVLAERAYGDLALREFTDLDIVLPHSQILAAHREMERLNYRSDNAEKALAEDRIPGQYAYRGERSILIELHTEKTMRYLPVPLDWKILRERFETVYLGGQPARTFSTEDMLVLICVHGSKHFWTRLGWICDVAELVQSPPGIDWAHAEDRARTMGCYRMWLLGLALANEVFAAPLPHSVAEQIRGDARIAELALRVRRQYLLGGEASVSAADRTTFRLHTQDNLRTGLRQLGIFATRPTDADWESHSLPRWAAPLYAVLRPIRMLRSALASSRVGR